jgi:hypothetical protein
MHILISRLSKISFVLALACVAGRAQTVTIVSSGSTNTAGFQIVVDQAGKADYQSPAGGEKSAPKTSHNKTIHKDIPQALAASLYASVNDARPLASLPPHGCAKSASFGTRMTVRLGDDVSPDLTCGDGGNEKMRALIRDTNAIVKIFQGN